MDNKNSTIVGEIRKIIGKNYVLINQWEKEKYTKGWRYGQGNALVVAIPGNLLEIWKVLEVCVRLDLIVIVQAANTGLTGGSTPDGNDYDRPLIIINTMRINDIFLIDNAKQIIALAGSTLFDLEKKIRPLGRDPHSVIGSTSIGASIVGGICNNSGGSLVQRGPAYTEMALYAKVNNKGELILVNELDINLGSSPEEILTNLQLKKFNSDDLIQTNKLASDNNYEKIVRDINSNIPSRFNSDPRLLSGVSGSAGKVVIFAVRLDTYEMPKKNKVFYLGVNNPDTFWKIRRHILSKFNVLPTSGDYLHRTCYDYAKKYSKDTFIILDKLGTKFLPALFKFKRSIDRISYKFKFLPNYMSDRLLQFITIFWPNHLPRRMNNFRNLYEHHWIIEMSDERINEARSYFDSFFESNEGSYFECTNNEANKAVLHRFTAASAFGRYELLNKDKIGGTMSMDVAFPRNEKNWFEVLPDEIDKLFEIKLYYGHLFCHVMHQNYIVKKGVNIDYLKQKLLKYYDSRGAKYPAEHNVGHEYKADSNLLKFYMELDPTNSFNPGIGQTSKQKYWK